MNYIIGINTISEILKYKPEIIKKVYTIRQKNSKNRKCSLINQLQRKKIEVEYLSKEKMFSLVSTDSHQSFIAEIRNRNYVHIDDFLSKDEMNDKSIVLMLDNILDPHNIGAIFRSSECFDIDGIVFSKNRFPKITPVVTKVSSGASELINLIQVSNLAESLKKFKKFGYQILVAENSKNAISMQDVPMANKVLIIMGSEEKGVQELLRKNADFLVKIPLYGKINSLNVSVATAVILSYFKEKLA